jgi:hypothetical protein
VECCDVLGLASGLGQKLPNVRIPLDVLSFRAAGQRALADDHRVEGHAATISESTESASVAG